MNAKRREYIVGVVTERRILMWHEESMLHELRCCFLKKRIIDMKEKSQVFLLIREF